MIESFSVKSQDEKFIEEVKKRTNHELKFSTIVIQALKLWFKDPTKTKLLPTWQEFKFATLEMSELDFKDTKEQLKHLNCILKATEQYRNGVVIDES